MTPRRTKTYVWLFLLLSAAVGSNVLLMQPRPPANTGAVAITIDPGPANAPSRVTAPSRTTTGQSAPAPHTDAASLAASRDTIKAVQRELTRLGFYAGPSDGIDTALTRAAVWAFEQSRGLPVRAEPDGALLKELLFASDSQPTEGPAVVQPRSPAAEQMLRAVQQGLVRSGYLAGPDGRMSEATTRAIRDFETTHGMRPTGRISADLIVQLSSSPAKNTPTPR